MVHHTIKCLHCCGRSGILVVSLSVYVLGLLCLLLRHTGSSAKTSPWQQLRINQKHILYRNPAPSFLHYLPTQLHPPLLNINLFFDKVYLLNLLSWPFTAYFTLLNLSPVTIRCVGVELLKTHHLGHQLSCQKRDIDLLQCIFIVQVEDIAEKKLCFSQLLSLLLLKLRNMFSQWEKCPEW